MAVLARALAPPLTPIPPIPARLLLQGLRVLRVGSFICAKNGLFIAYARPSCRCTHVGDTNKRLRLPPRTGLGVDSLVGDEKMQAMIEEDSTWENSCFRERSGELSEGGVVHNETRRLLRVSTEATGAPGEPRRAPSGHLITGPCPDTSPASTLKKGLQLPHHAPGMQGWAQTHVQPFCLVRFYPYRS